MGKTFLYLSTFHLKEDHLFRILKENTKAVLSGQIVEAERSFSDEELTSYS